MRRLTLVLVTFALLVAGLVPATAAAGTPPCHVVKFSATGKFVGTYGNPRDAIGGGDVSDIGSTLFITGTCSGPVWVIVSMNLVGRGPAALDGHGQTFVLSTFPGTTVNVTNLRIQNGSSEGIAGLANSAVMHLTDSSVIGNSGCNGGIANSGTLTIEHSTISGNSSPFNCGGSGIFNTGTLTLIDSTVSGNTGGGGIAGGGTMTITNSSIDGNTSLAYGGGIYNWGTTTITGSSVSGNAASYGGGGITNTAFATMTVTDSQIRGNTAGLGGGGVINGGGIENLGSVTLTRSTVAGNNANLWGGGILNIGGYGGSLTLDGAAIGTFAAPNTSGSRGGGILNYGGAVIFANHPTTIAHNQTAVAGGGIYTRPYSSSLPGSVICGSPSLVIYGPGNSPDNSYDEALGANTICP